VPYSTDEDFVSDLIDTTQMYLRTIVELEEEGIVPMRARIAERLSQSGPTVSQTVARMERDGLLVVSGDRHLELTPLGREAGTRVMRKHRLAECMLVSLLGMEWEDVHVEACRWEHVMSDAVERRLLVVLGNPTVSPYGNPIPGLDELVPDLVAPVSGPLAPLAAVAGDDVRTVVLRRIAEPLQTDGEAMLTLRRVGANPGASIHVQRAAEGILIGSGGEYAEVSLDTASHLLVDAPA
jgi:DtxR family Mn-dependent transcriptional regulator